MVTLGEVVEWLHKCGAIICDDFAKCAPSAKDVFEDPVAQGLHGFSVECMVLQEMCEQTATLDEILEAS